MSAQPGKDRKPAKPKKGVGETRLEYRTRDRSGVTLPRNIILEKCRQTLARHYGEQLKDVILYGSMARGQAAPVSDIDLLVVLAPPVNYFVELRRLVEVLYPLQLESERLISAKPVSESDFEAGSISLYRNARREGRVI
ncbi:MAG: nucleotidyltransferase domain-containing protein [Chloroflexota bacterium]